MLAVKSPYSCSEDCVRVTGVKSQPFSTGVGLRQWCVLLPLLFIVYIRVLRTTAGGRNLTFQAISPGHKIMKKYFIYKKCDDLECNISRKKHIAQDVQPSNCCAIAYVVLSQKIRRALVYMNWIDNHRHVDEGFNVGNCRMNRLFFADELVLHAWIFTTGSSARI